MKKRFVIYNIIVIVLISTIIILAAIICSKNARYNELVNEYETAKTDFQNREEELKDTIDFCLKTERSLSFNFDIDRRYYEEVACNEEELMKKYYDYYNIVMAFADEWYEEIEYYYDLLINDDNYEEEYKIDEDLKKQIIQSQTDWENNLESTIDFKDRILGDQSGGGSYDRIFRAKYIYKTYRARAMELFDLCKCYYRLYIKGTDEDEMIVDVRTSQGEIIFQRPYLAGADKDILWSFHTLYE